MLDKLDYCASVNNLDAVKDCPNFEVREPGPVCGLFTSLCAASMLATLVLWGSSEPLCLMQLVKGDIQSADLIGHLLTQHNIDTVMHFAAQVTSLIPA